MATIVVLTWVVLPGVQSALAQYVTGPPGRPTKPIWEWLMAALFTGVCVAIAFMNPKRSHLD